MNTPPIYTDNITLLFGSVLLAVVFVWVVKKSFKLLRF